MPRKEPPLSDPKRRRLHICFVAPTAWPLLSGDRSFKTVGGAELQQAILARALASRGYRVSMICMDYGQPDDSVIDGITVLKCYAPSQGVPLFRFFHPRFTTVWSAMRRTEADVYYQRGCGALTGFVAAFCRTYRRAFIYAAAHNADFHPRSPVIKYGRDRAIFRWGLRRSSLILVQNQAQLEDCHIHFGRSAILLPNCYAPPATACNDPSGYVLWVSTMRNWKRPELLLDIAEQLPQLQFRMIGGPDNQDHYAALRRRADRLPNVSFVGFVPYADIEREFDGARILVNTSEWEGFPNTFLQAWSRRIPTVSFFDVGAVADGRSIITRARSLDEMTSAIDLLMTEHMSWKDAGERCYRYYLQKHAPDRIVDQLSSVIDRILVNTTL